MGLETGDYISDLVDTNPTPGDPKAQGDDHLRLIKKVLKKCFPNITGPMLVAHDQVASKDYVDQAAFSTSLPAQVLGFLRSTGAAASFGTTHAGYAQNEVKGADIASAATINLTTATGNLVHVTGTTGITAITIPVGAERELIFDGALTLTHSAALLLPGAANIATQAGDRATVRGDAAGAIVTHYQRADGKALAVDGQTHTLLGTAVVASPVAQIDFLNIFTATYDKYVIEVLGVQPSAASMLALRAAVAGAVVTTGLYSPMLGNATSSASTAVFAQMGSGAGNYTPSSEAPGITIELRNVNSTTGPKGIGARGVFVHENNTTREGICGESFFNSNSVVTGFRLFWNTGVNFTKGTVRVYGVRNAA
ncbi:hypothetical protein [Massilia sp. DD77]|uniref:hypothetical protein n=1 Tax=Massilia sp. DD77 TaxID=3109349 RepID=UPI002FFE464C